MPHSAVSVFRLHRRSSDDFRVGNSKFEFGIRSRQEGHVAAVMTVYFMLLSSYLTDRQAVPTDNDSVLC